MVSATQAIFILGSDLTICCVPSVLSFGSQPDAGKFQKGFGGTHEDITLTIPVLEAGNMGGFGVDGHMP